MFKTRLLSGIVLVILALFLIISGHEILLFATLAISCIGMFELYRVFKMEKTVLAGVGYLAAIVYYCNLQWKFLPDLMILFMAFLILLMFVFVFAYPKFHADQVMAAFFGFFYVAVMLSYVYQIRTLERGLLPCRKLRKQGEAMLWHRNRDSGFVSFSFGSTSNTFFLRT